MNGSIYTWSAINSYFASYLHYNGNEKIKPTDTFFLMPCIFLVQYFFMAPGVKLGDEITVRGSTIIAVILMVGSYFLLIFSTNFPVIILGFCIFGMGDGLGNLSVIKNCWLYFPNNKALINGIILGAYGLNSAILNPLADFIIINPNKEEADDDGYYPENVANNLKDFLYFVMIMFGVLGIIAIILSIPYENDISDKINDVIIADNNNKENLLYKDSIANNDESIGTKKSNKTKSDTSNKYTNINTDLNENSNSTISLNSKQNKFWIGFLSVPNFELGVICFCVPFFLYLLTNTNRAFGNSCDISQLALQLMAVLFGVINGATRFVWGLLMDKYNFKILMYIIMTLEIIISFTVYYTKINDILFVVVNLLSAVSLSGFFTTITPTFNKVFGFKNGAKIYGLTGILIGVASFLGPVLTKIFIKDEKKELYRNIYFVGGGFIIFSFISLFFFEEKSFDYNSHLHQDSHNDSSIDEEKNVKNIKNENLYE